MPIKFFWPSAQTYWGYLCIFYIFDMINHSYHNIITAVFFGLSIGACCVWVYSCGHEAGATMMSEFYITHNMLKTRPSEGESK